MYRFQDKPRQGQQLASGHNVSDFRKDGACHVRHMIGRIEIDTIPASGHVSMITNNSRHQRLLRFESQVNHDACRAWFLGKVLGLRVAGAHGLETSIRQLWVLVGLGTCVCGGRPDDHSKSLAHVSSVPEKHGMWRPPAGRP
jgi:hypothetical protein